ncbi:hypothetical protein Efla_003182 [Eimeria flavescens]
MTHKRESFSGAEQALTAAEKQQQPQQQAQQQQQRQTQTQQQLLAFQPFSFLIDVSFWRLLSERKLKVWRLDTPWIPLVATYGCTAAKPLQPQQQPHQQQQKQQQHRGFSVGPSIARIDADALDLVQQLQHEQQEQQELQQQQQPEEGSPAQQQQQQQQQITSELLLQQAWLDGDSSSPLPSPEAAEAEAAAAAAAGAAAGAPPPPAAAAAGRSRRSALMCLPPFAAKCLRNGTRPLVGLLRVHNSLEDLAAATATDCRVAAARCMQHLEEAICCCSSCKQRQQQQQPVMSLPLDDPALWSMHVGCCDIQQQQQQEGEQQQQQQEASPKGQPAALGASSTSPAAAGSAPAVEFCAARAVYGQLAASAWPCRFALEAFIDLKRQRAFYGVCAPAVRPAVDIQALAPPAAAALPVTLEEIVRLIPDPQQQQQRRQQQRQQQQPEAQGQQREAFTAAELSAISSQIRNLGENKAPFLASGCFLAVKTQSSTSCCSSSSTSNLARTSSNGCGSAEAADAEEAMELLPLEALERLRDLLPDTQRSDQQQQERQQQQGQQQRGEQQQQKRLYLCLMDPSSNPEALGWPLRSLLPALTERFHLWGRELRILSFRDWLLDLRVESAGAAAVAAEAAAAAAEAEAQAAAAAAHAEADAAGARGPVAAAALKDAGDAAAAADHSGKYDEGGSTAAQSSRAPAAAAAATAAQTQRTAAAAVAAAAAAWGQLVVPQSRIFVARLPTAEELAGAFSIPEAAEGKATPAAAAGGGDKAAPAAAAAAGGAKAAAGRGRASMVVGRIKRAVPSGALGGAPRLEGLFEVDLGRFLDPQIMQQEAEDLNIQLIRQGSKLRALALRSASSLKFRWRVLPSFVPESLQSLRVLAIGAGTLGCGVARLLAAWGVKAITFVDGGRVALNNPSRQSLFSHQDAAADGGLGRLKAEAARDGIIAVRPSMECNAVVLDVPMPGHPRFLSGDSLERRVEALQELIDRHDVVFLLTDSRESRWLPSLLVAERQERFRRGLLGRRPPLALTVALGFDSMLVMRHGYADNGLGCYFCHAVNGPGDSISHRTLDEQCTVTRPGVGALACSVAVELLASLTQHPEGFAAPHTEVDPLAGGSAAAAAAAAAVAAAAAGESGEDSQQTRRSTKGFSCLGATPHMIRANFADFTLLKEHQPCCVTCSCCSAGIVSAFQEGGLHFLRDAVGRASLLEEYSGLAAFKDSLRQKEADVLSFSEWE